MMQFIPNLYLYLSFEVRLIKGSLYALIPIFPIIWGYEVPHILTDNIFFGMPKTWIKAWFTSIIIPELSNRTMLSMAVSKMSKNICLDILVSLDEETSNVTSPKR